MPLFFFSSSGVTIVTADVQEETAKSRERGGRGRGVGEG